MNKHAESISHSYDAVVTISSTKRDLGFRLFSSSPMSALTELHNLVQNTHHYGPADYVVTHLKRDGLTAYELSPGMTNPDVRHRPRGEKTGVVTVEMFPLSELNGSPSDTPIFSPPAGALAASTASPS